MAQLMVTLMFTAFTPIMHKADEFAEHADTRGIEMINYSQLVVRFILWGGIAFMVVFFGADKTSGLVKLLPEALITGFKIAGGMMPAVGFALLLNIMLKKEYTPFLIGGFILAAYLKLDVLAVALLGVAIAMYDYYTSNNAGNMKVAQKEENYDEGI
jgi:phosphotransferase system PTS sorbose-specific IIC subunit